MKRAMLRKIEADRLDFHWTAGPPDNDNSSKGQRNLLREVAKAEPSQTGATETAQFKVVVFAHGELDRKILEALLTSQALQYALVNNADDFIDRMKVWPRALGIVHIFRDGGDAVQRLKADPVCADRPLLLYCSHSAIHLAEGFGGEACSVFETGYPFSLPKLIEMIDRFR